LQEIEKWWRDRKDVEATVEEEQPSVQRPSWGGDPIVDGEGEVS